MKGTAHASAASVSTTTGAPLRASAMSEQPKPMGHSRRRSGTRVPGPTRSVSLRRTMGMGDGDGCMYVGGLDACKGMHNGNVQQMVRVPHARYSHVAIEVFTF